MNKGGKFIFGLSVIKENLSMQLPVQAIEEYDITSDGRIYLFSGSKLTGGFCVTKKGLLEPSKLGHILIALPDLQKYALEPGTFVKYKGRSYCWIEITKDGNIQLTQKMMDLLELHIGMGLLSIRSSNIAFTMGAKGPLLEKAAHYRGEIPNF